MTQETYNALVPYKELMRTIIINSAASNLPISYRQTLQSAGTELGLKLSCTCSSGWFKLTSDVYKEFLKYKSEQDDNKETKDTTSKENTDRKSGAKNKRK